MRALLITFLALQSLSVFATTISATDEGEYIMPRIQLDVQRSYQVMGRYLQENLGCTNMKLCITDLKEPYYGGFLNLKKYNGSYELKFTVTCSKNISNFRFDMGPAWDYELYTDVIIGYNDQNGKYVEVDLFARNAEDYMTATDINFQKNCDSSPIDTDLPYYIITKPSLLRTFPK